MKINKTGGGSWVRCPSLTHGGASRLTLLRSALYLFVYSSALGKMLSFALKKIVDQSIANRVFSLSSGSQPLSDYLISGAVR